MAVMARNREAGPVRGRGRDNSQLSANRQGLERPKLLVGTGRFRRGPVRFGSQGLPQRSGGHQYFGLIEGTRRDQQDGLPIKQSDDLTSSTGVPKP